LVSGQVSWLIIKESWVKISSLTIKNFIKITAPSSSSIRNIPYIEMVPYERAQKKSSQETSQ